MREGGREEGRHCGCVRACGTERYRWWEGDRGRSRRRLGARARATAREREKERERERERERESFHFHTRTQKCQGKGQDRDRKRQTYRQRQKQRQRWTYMRYLSNLSTYTPTPTNTNTVMRSTGTNDLHYIQVISKKIGQISPSHHGHRLHDHRLSVWSNVRKEGVSVDFFLIINRALHGAGLVLPIDPVSIWRHGN